MKLNYPWALISRLSTTYWMTIPLQLELLTVIVYLWEKELV